MFIGNFRSFDSAYGFIINAVKAEGFVCNPRNNGATIEMRPASFCIDNPIEALYTGSERRLNYGFHAVEAAMYMAGARQDQYKEIEDTRILCALNRNMLKFVNQKTHIFDGAYGPRMSDGLQKVYDLLKDDLWSRQASVSLWNNVEKRAGETLDVPCTMSLQFFCTDTEEIAPLLNLHVTMRSNDLNWGTPYDIAAFCEILCNMADCLGLNVGRYYHSVGSLHIYHDTPPKVNAWNNFTHAHGTKFERTPTAPRNWGVVQSECASFLDECFRSYYESNFTSIVLDDRLTDSSTIKRFKKMMKWSWRKWDQENA